MLVVMAAAGVGGSSVWGVGGGGWEEGKEDGVGVVVFIMGGQGVLAVGSDAEESDLFDLEN
jgi:hypothetical protein